MSGFDRFPHRPLAGPGVALVVWAVDFAVMYAGTTFWCGHPALGWIATLGCAAIALAVLLCPLRAAWSARDAAGDQDTQRLARDAAIVISLLALIAILWHGIAVLSLPAC
jgi:uncharacterized RDD family membrane protein YckC